MSHLEADKGRKGGRSAIGTNKDTLQDPYLGFLFCFQVYDGNSSVAPELARLCGTQQPGIINSTGHELFVKLRTDSSIAAGGFLASYTSSMMTLLFHIAKTGHDNNFENKRREGNFTTKIFFPGFDSNLF